MLSSDIHKLVYFIWNKEQFPQQWEENINVRDYKKGDKLYWSTYRRITSLPTTHCFIHYSCLKVNSLC